MLSHVPMVLLVMQIPVDTMTLVTLLDWVEPNATICKVQFRAFCETRDHDFQEP